MSEYHVLKDLAIIFAVSLLVILVFHRIKLPALPGFIVAGVLLGPNALGLVSDVHQVESLAEVGRSRAWRKSASSCCSLPSASSSP